MENLNEKLIGFLTNNPGANKTAIGEALELKRLVLFNFLKKMEKENVIVSNNQGDELSYSLAVQPRGTEIVEPIPTANEETSPDITIEENADTNVETVKQQDTVKEAKVSKGRDNSKFKFNGEEYGKGALVRSVVIKYVADNPTTTYRQLKEVFPNELLKRFGIFEEIEKAREISGKYDRYNFNEEYQIRLVDKKKVVVCTQFTAQNIQPFLKTAKKLGYKIS